MWFEEANSQWITPKIAGTLFLFNGRIQSTGALVTGGKGYIIVPETSKELIQGRDLEHNQFATNKGFRITWTLN